MGVFLLLLFCLSLATSYSINCGQYLSPCIKNGPIYSDHVLDVNTNFAKEISRVLYSEDFHTSSDCAGTPIYSVKYTIQPTLQIRTDKYDDYTFVYTDGSLVVNDVNTFSTLGFSCNPQIKSTGSVSLESVFCTQASLPFSSLYNAYNGQSVSDSRVIQGSNSLRIFNIDTYLLSTKPCNDITWINWVNVGIIAGVVLILVIVIVVIACRIKRKSQSGGSKTKKN